MARKLDYYSGGEWVSSPNRFGDMNPANGDVWADVADADLSAVRQAIQTAQEAFSGWASLPHTKRAHYMIAMAQEFANRQSDVVDALKAEAGGWFGKGMFESGYVPEVFHAAAATTYAPIGEIMPSEHHKLSIASRRPIGVVSVISPWNFPALLSSRGFAFPLAAGNTIVLKPSEETPYTGGLIFAEIAEAVGLPPGVLNVVTCSRDNVMAVGNELVENPLVKGISFTGSTAVGRQIAAKAGAHLKKACIELGGKDALIICDDADMERALGAANFGSFMHQGQICMSVEKVLVHQSIYADFLNAFVKRAGALKMGDPSESDGNVIGPLINDKQLDNVQSQLQDAIAKGAKVEVGGQIQGRYIQPTILTGVTADMSIYQKETFGPVVPVIPFNTDDQAIAIANDTEYGLSSGVITRDEQRGLAIAHALDTGMCHINCSSVNDEPHIPFGGSKSSGVGRHGGRWSTETFTETRWITIDRGGRPYPPMF